MSAHSHPEGLAIARELIAREAEERTGVLDLGRLGLVEPPAELLDLTHLRRLNLGGRWWDVESKSWRDPAYNLAPNLIGPEWAALSRLTVLTLLNCSYAQLSDLKLMAVLTELTSLNCSGTQVSDLTPLIKLTALNSLYFSGTQVSDLTPLETLTALTSLNCSSTPVSDLKPLMRLTALASLDCSHTQVSDLRPLATLTALTSLQCSSTPVSDMRPLAPLTALTFLCFSFTHVSDLRPLASLAALTRLDCVVTPIRDLRSLASLTALTSLNCSETLVSDLAPLATLSALTSLSCSGTHISDLRPLAMLTALTSLNCSKTPISDLTPLASLTKLTTLNCWDTLVSDLTPIATLTALTSLHFFKTQVSDLTPLASLTALTELSCSESRVSDLTPLATHTRLTKLNCSVSQVSDLAPLVTLTGLTSLNCYGTHVRDLTPLARLTALTSLDCSGTQVRDLTPLAALTALKSLECYLTQVNDLKPLETLTALTSLSCFRTRVRDLTPLASLTALISLNCIGTQVSDLGPLETLTSLTYLYCSDTPLREIPDRLIWRESLKSLIVHNVSLSGIPAEVLSPDPNTSCLETLRAHLSDLKAGESAVPDVKILVIGNGRIGKTQLCRRLRGEPFEVDADSTHGITVTGTDVPLKGVEPARLHLWDFGGQDLYHGTHALFMRTRAVFVLLWTPESENTETHEHGGMTFRNQPLAYWLGYVRHLAGTDCPVLVVQNQCDTPADERLHPPLDDAALADFGYRKLLHYSAKEDRCRAALDEALRESIAWLRAKQGQARIGKGRLAVKRRLEAMRDADAELPVAEKRHRTIAQEHFHELCAEASGVSSPPLLLDYLHQCGIVFYRKGLFGDRIVLDQAWALDAVYAVFNRKKCYKQLQHLRGRFTRPLLEALVWQDYSVEEQNLFLSMMRSCGICFIHRRGSRDEEIETEYIAPDLLPERSVVADEIEARWPVEELYEEMGIEYRFLHPGLVRGIISRVGREAGQTAIYWNEGVCGYERKTRSHVLLEVRRDGIAVSPTGQMRLFSGKLTVRAAGSHPMELLTRIEEWIGEEGVRAGTHGHKLLSLHRPYGGIEAREIGGIGDATEPETHLALVFDTPPREGITYCVSYGWRDDSIERVDELCAAAEAKGIHILRDTTGMGLGDRISQFMLRLAEGDRVFIILSAKYLESPYCMTELFEVWRNCRQRDEEFIQRVRVFRLPDAKIKTPLDRTRCAVYWKEQFEALDAIVKSHGATVLGEADFHQYKLMQDFAHRVGDILFVINDTLKPREFAEFLEHGFEEGKPDA
jgi:internalin A